MEIDKLSAKMEIRNLLEDLWKIFDTKVFGSPSSERRFNVWMKTRYEDFRDCIRTLIPGKPMKYCREPLYGYWYAYELKEDPECGVRLEIYRCSPSGERELTGHDKTEFYFFELLLTTIQEKSFFIPQNSKPEDCEFSRLMMNAAGLESGV